MWNDLKYSYIFNTFCNLFLNIYLGKLLGITGILIASLVTCIISGTFWQCIIIFKNYFNVSAREYIINQIQYFMRSGVIILIAYVTCNFIPAITIRILELGVRSIVCVLMTSVLLFFMYHKNIYFNEAVCLLKKVVKR